MSRNDRRQTVQFKTYPRYFEPALAGLKRAEVRPASVMVAVGDSFVLREYTIEGSYTGRELACIATHVCRTPYNDSRGRALQLISFKLERD